MCWGESSQVSDWSSPDELLQYIQPAHPCSVVQRGAAVVTTSVGIGSSFEEDPDTVQVTVNNSYVESRLTFYIDEVHLGSLGDQVGHAGGVSCCGSDPQRGAGQTAATPHRLLIDTSGNQRREGSGYQLCPSQVSDFLKLIHVPHIDQKHTFGSSALVIKFTAYGVCYAVQDCYMLKMFWDIFCTLCVFLRLSLREPTLQRNHKPLSATHERSGQKLPVLQWHGAHSHRWGTKAILL